MECWTDDTFDSPHFSHAIRARAVLITDLGTAIELTSDQRDNRLNLMSSCRANPSDGCKLIKRGFVLTQDPLSAFFSNRLCYVSCVTDTSERVSRELLAWQRCKTCEEFWASRLKCQSELQSAALMALMATHDERPEACRCIADECIIMAIMLDPCEHFIPRRNDSLFIETLIVWERSCNTLPRIEGQTKNAGLLAAQFKTPYNIHLRPRRSPVMLPQLAAHQPPGQPVQILVDREPPDCLYLYQRLLRVAISDANLRWTRFNDRRETLSLSASCSTSYFCISASASR